MSNLLNTGNIVQARIWCSDAEQASVNTVYYLCGFRSGFGPNDQDMADQLSTIVGPLIKPILYNGATYDGLTCQVINVTPMGLAAQSIQQTGAGTGGAIGMSRQTAAVCSWRTALAGPRYRGRMYLPFPSTSGDAGLGVPSGAYTTAAAALCNALFTFGTTTGGGFAIALTQVVYSRIPPTAATPIDNFLGLNKWGTIKKRGSFGKPNSSPF